MTEKKSGFSLWVKEIINIAILVAGLSVFRTTIYAPYVIPTGSMLPTLKINDRILANKLAYGLILPFVDSQIVSWSAPKRGEIVLFQSPTDEHTYIKRVAGVDGDKISFKEGKLLINGHAVGESIQTDRSILEDMGDTGVDKNLFLESIPGSSPHFILRMKAGGVTFFENREFVVPAGKVFCLGDNRDGSNDSRFWGFVDVKKIFGRAGYIWFSTLHSDSWIPHFRTGRILKSLQ